MQNTCEKGWIKVGLSPSTNGKSVGIGSYSGPYFPCIRTEYGEIQSISPYLVRMWENKDQNNSEYRHLIRSIRHLKDFLDFFWISYLCSIYVLCPGVSLAQLGEYSRKSLGIVAKSVRRTLENIEIKKIKKLAQNGIKVFPP